MHGGETASPVRMLKAPRWKLHSTMSSSMKPSDKEPGPWVQESSVTKMDPLRLKTANTNSPTSTLIAAPTGTSEARQMKRRSVQARVTHLLQLGRRSNNPRLPISRAFGLAATADMPGKACREGCHMHAVGTITKY